MTPMLFFEAYLILFAFGAAVFSYLYYLDRPVEEEGPEKALKLWSSLNEIREAKEHEPYEIDYQEAA